MTTRYQKSSAHASLLTPALTSALTELLKAVSLLLVVLVVVFWQPWHATSNALALAFGTPLCTTEGSKLVDANGDLVDSGHQHGGDCCCPSAPPVPVAVFALPQPVASSDAPAALLSAGWSNAEWLGALSRGPPLSTI